jgi:tetratricopeptide (TPR) repeat protein
MGRAGNLLRRAAGAPVRALMPKSAWGKLIVISIPILLLLAFLEPVVNLLSRVVDLFARVLSPLVQDPTGRLVLVSALLAAAAAIAFSLLRGRIRAFRGGLLLRRHLEGVGLFVLGQDKRARELLRKVASARGPLPSVYPVVAQDACLKLARLALAAGHADQAMAWLARVREKGLPRELRRSLHQLRAHAFAAEAEVLPESLEAELRASLEAFKGDRVLLRHLREVVSRRGDLDAAAEIQERIAAVAPPPALGEERDRLFTDLLAAGRAALLRGDTDRARAVAKKARSLDPEADGPRILQGEIKLAAGDLRAAVREWGRIRSAAGIERIARALDEQPGALQPREILECCPTEGGLLVVARELSRLGEHRKALRAARRAARVLGPSPSVAAVLAEVLRRSGQEVEADRLCEEAALRLLAPG